MSAIVSDKRIHDGEKPWVEAIMAFNLNELIGFDETARGDYAEENIFDEGESFTIVNILYHVVSSDALPSLKTWASRLKL